MTTPVRYKIVRSTGLLTYPTILPSVSINWQKHRASALPFAFPFLTVERRAERSRSTNYKYLTRLQKNNALQTDQEYMLLPVDFRSSHA